MKKLSVLFVAILVLVGCQNPAGSTPVTPVVPVTPVTPVTPTLQKTSIPVPDAYTDVAKAAYLIRAAGTKAVSRDIAGAAVGDPIAPECTDVGALYWFKDDNSVTEYVSKDAAAYADLKQRAKTSADIRSITNPDAPWGFIANDPAPAPAPVYLHDPVLNPGEIRVVYNSDNGQTCVDSLTYAWTLATLADYNDALPKMPGMLGQWNALHPTNQGHLVYGGPPAS